MILKFHDNISKYRILRKTLLFRLPDCFTNNQNSLTSLLRVPVCGLAFNKNLTSKLKIIHRQSKTHPRRKQYSNYLPLEEKQSKQANLHATHWSHHRNKTSIPSRDHNDFHRLNMKKYSWLSNNSTHIQALKIRRDSLLLQRMRERTR